MLELCTADPMSCCHLYYECVGLLDVENHWNGFAPASCLLLVYLRLMLLGKYDWVGYHVTCQWNSQQYISSTVHGHNERVVEVFTSIETLFVGLFSGVHSVLSEDVYTKILPNSLQWKLLMLPNLPLVQA